MPRAFAPPLFFPPCFPDCSALWELLDVEWIACPHCCEILHCSPTPYLLTLRALEAALPRYTAGISQVKLRALVIACDVKAMTIYHDDEDIHHSFVWPPQHRIRCGGGVH